MDLLTVPAVDLLRCALARDHLLRTDLLAINPREFLVVFHVSFCLFPEIFFAINSFLIRRCGKLQFFFLSATGDLVVFFQSATAGLDLGHIGCGFEPNTVRI